MNITECSKFLSFVLRHRPDTIGLTLDEAGWCNVVELLYNSIHHGKNIDVTLLRKVVRENNKKRFEFSEDGFYIRASQGHSVKVDLGYEESVPLNTYIMVQLCSL